MRKQKKRVWPLLTACTLALSAGWVMPTNTKVAAAAPVFSAEAEACTVTTGGTVTTNVYGTEYPGYTGEGFVWAGNAGGMTFDVTLTEGAMYEISTRCWMYLGEVGEARLQTVAIDGTVEASQQIPNTGTWSDFSFGFFYLPAGKHTIEIGATGSWGFILYDAVTFDFAVMPELNITPVPSDPKATSETKALMTYLTKQYGNHILSGQQEIYGSGNDGDYELEFEYLFDNTGKYPVVRGFDFMNYNPLYGWEDGTTGRMIQWVTKRGGIATASWHINVPVNFDTYTLGDALDWKECTYKPTASFKTANCLVKGTKEYDYLMLAVADLAEQLLLLQEAKVPVILRPFHEAEGNNNTDGSGAWFWWGSGGAEVYRSLWKLLYTTLTETYGIHNCLFEVNLYDYANSAQWYPGDDCVDMVAYDKYEGSPYTWKTEPATSVFLTLVNDTNDTKMVALSENDVIPSVEGMVNEGAWWSYFCPWYGSFLTDGTTNPVSHLKEIYNSDAVVTLDEVPNDLYGYVRGNDGNWNVPNAIECEEGTLIRNNGTTVIDYKYCSGTGYVFLKGEDDAVTQTVTVKEAGTYTLSYGYQQNYEEAGKTQKLVINGKDAGELFFPYSILFTETKPLQVELQAGENTIQLVAAEGWTYLDYLLVGTGSGAIAAGMKGDVNLDQSVDVADVILLNRYLAEDTGVSIAAQGLLNAECDGKANLTTEDCSTIMKWIAKLITAFPSEVA